MSLARKFQRCSPVRYAFILALVAACTETAREISDVVAKLPPGACGGEATLISSIQGITAVSPLLGNSVIVEAVVVGDYQESRTSHPAHPELRGFFLHEEDKDTDGDAATSEGLFVFDPRKTLELSAGDRVRVAGIVGEFAKNTQVEKVSMIQLCGTGLSVSPARIDLPVPTSFATLDDFYGPVEGMRVYFSDVMTVTEHYELGRYGQVMLSEGGRLRAYSQDALLPLNRTDHQAHQNAQARRSIKLDDFNTRQNMDPVYFPQPGNFAADNYIRVGAEISGLSGVIHKVADEWVVQAIKSSPPAMVNPPRPTTSPAVGGNIRLATLNVLNYFNGDGLGGGFPTSRGADSQAELDRQTAKIVATVRGLDADVLGLMEIENDGGGANDALAYLVNEINKAIGANTFAAVRAGGKGGSDDIKVALIYKPAVLEAVGPPQALSSQTFTDPNHIGRQQNRPALAQTFRVIAIDNPDRGSAFTTVVLHLKSKSSECGAGDDDRIQGKCNLTRSKAAKALLDWLAADPTDTRVKLGKFDPDVFIIGDLNAYYQEDPVQALLKAGYRSLVAQSDHTYVYDGKSGTLDYILASPSLLEQQVPGEVHGAVWHINADENSLLDYNDSVMDVSEAAFEAKPSSEALYAPDAWRSSDHDPVVAGMDLAGTKQ